jgi:REP element-mobilizing transposase RayT
MATARAHLVNPSVALWYHCTSRCVRQAFLLNDEHGVSRKQWLEKRIEFLTEHLAISVASFAIMDNHFHMLVRLDPDRADQWSDEEVARRWLTLCPPRDRTKKGTPDEIMQACIAEQLKQPGWVQEIRKRLKCLSWFMRLLKEPLARMANKQDNKKGHFFEGRFKSIAVLDEESLLATSAYIDLNPVAANLAATPEESQHTSIEQRVKHVKKQHRLRDLQVPKDGTVADPRRTACLEDDHWLCPIEDRRNVDSKRQAMVEGFTLGRYLLLVDYTGRLIRHGKASLPAELEGIFERLGTDAETWRERIEKFQKRNFVGRFLAASKQRLKEVAAALGLKRVMNLDHCPAS